ncbi:MAG: N-6 DNA methylase, partial [Chloroflexota bacterium]
MQTRNRNPFTTIHTEGALLPSDLLQRILDYDKSLPGLTPEAYHLSGEKLNEAINRSWNRLQGAWAAFGTSRARLGESDAGTGLTRDRWLYPLFDELDFGRLQAAKGLEIDGKPYAISHIWAKVPIHLVGCGVDLEKRSAGVVGASKASPHSLLQEYLNRSSDALWGIVTNGLRLRVLRDNATLTRQAFLEFDLEAMFDGEVYADFALLWLICHQSRLEVPDGATECALEQWSKSAQEQGTRALTKLRAGVEQAIAALGSGFLKTQSNQKLRGDLRSGTLATQDYYRQLLRLVYRLIFLFVAEDRDLLFDPAATPKACERYLKYYSLQRLRRLAARTRGSRHPDLYESLKQVMDLLAGTSAKEETRLELGLPILGGFLFSDAALPDLDSAELENEALLAALRHLTQIEEGSTRRAVDYKNLGSEELGGIYESLLELHPLVNTDSGSFELDSVAGNERKETGSYYTPSSLIQALLNSALDPVISQAIKNGNLSTVSQEKSLLSLKVCDPACGSGHFLVAASHRIARRLAQLRTGEGEPTPDTMRTALREVISHCIYGVDINPMSVELCKVNLWLESLSPGKPLSFLDSHIKRGNSLVGVCFDMKLENLVVPDEAFNQIARYDKFTSTLLKKRNKNEREGQESLFIMLHENPPNLDQEKWLAERARMVDAMPEDTAIEVQAKAKAYQNVSESTQYLIQSQIADLWTAAFFWKVDEPLSKSFEVVAPTHGQLRRMQTGQQTQAGLQEKIEKLRQAEGFFHWSLEFADVNFGGGFDCIIGNPPYIQIQTMHEKADILQGLGFESFARSGDIYCLFYERGVQLLQDGGILAFITSNKWMRAGYGEALRNFLAEKTNPIQLIDFSGQKIFESATVDVNLLILEKAKNKYKTKSCVITDSSSLNNLSVFIEQHQTINQFSTRQSWTILSSMEQRIKSKIENLGKPLKDWEISINYGIKTGFNEAFIIDGFKRKELLEEDPKSAEIIRPILRGRDIKRYGYEFQNLWLINSHNGNSHKGTSRINIEEYPAIKRHLDKYYDSLTVRFDKGDTPYNLRSCAYMDDFYKQKMYLLNKSWLGR